MASDISRAKVDKLMSGDLGAQAAIVSVAGTNRLIAEAAREGGISAPLIDASLDLCRRAEDLGMGNLDMIAVVRAFSAATRA